MAYDDPIEDAACIQEYLIANHIINGEYGCPNDLINDVVEIFDLNRQQAVEILDSVRFNQTLDNMIKLKEIILGSTIINGLAVILETGSIKQKLKAIELLDYIYRINQRENRERRQLKLL